MLAKNDTDFQKQVCKRDNYTCRVCGKVFAYSCYFDERDRNQHVCAHHLISKGSRTDLRLDITNGICVCDNCHKSIHNGNAEIDVEKSIDENRDMI